MPGRPSNLDRMLGLIGLGVGGVCVVAGFRSVATAEIGNPRWVQWLAAVMGATCLLSAVGLAVRHFVAHPQRGGTGWIGAALTLLLPTALISVFAFGDWVYQDDALRLIVSDFGVHAIVFGVMLLLSSVGILVDSRRDDRQPAPTHPLNG